MVFSNAELARRKAYAFSSQTVEFLETLPYFIKQYGEKSLFEDTGEKQELLISSASTLLPSYTIQSFLNEWFFNEIEPFCVLLAGYGMGKTITCMDFAKKMLGKEYSSEAIIPIYVDLRTVADKKLIFQCSIKEILEIFLKNSLCSGYTEEGLLTAEEIIGLVSGPSGLIIFDGLDEVLIHLSRAEGQVFVQKLLSIFSGSTSLNLEKPAKVLLSCRTQFFKTSEEQKKYFINQSYYQKEQFSVLKILNLETDQIKNYLKETIQTDNESEESLLNSIYGLSDLASRPYMLSLIARLMPSIKELTEIKSDSLDVVIYNHMVESSLEWDLGKHTLALHHKLELLEGFAAQLWCSGKQSWTSIEIQEWIKNYIEENVHMMMHYTNNLVKVSSAITELLTENLLAASLLTRVGNENFRFAHTSIQEFFLARYLFSALKNGLMAKWNLPLVSKEVLCFIGELCFENQLHDFSNLNVFYTTYYEKISELVFAYSIFALQNGFPGPAIQKFYLKDAQLNDWTFLGKEEHFLDLSEVQFQGAHLQNSDFTYVNLNEANFLNANLHHVEIAKTYANDVNFQNTNLQHAVLRDVKFSHAQFEQAQFLDTQLTRCDLTQATGIDFNSPYILFEKCIPKNESNSVSSLGHQQALEHYGIINGCAYSKDGKFLVTASWDQTLCVWDLSKKACIKKLTGHTERVKDCVFSSCGRFLISVSDDQTVRIWNAKNWTCIHILNGHSGRVNHCAAFPDQTKIVSVSTDRTIRIWDIVSGTCLQVITGHEDTLRGCSVSSDGRLFSTASEDQTVRIWDTDSGQCLKVLEGHQSWVKGCQFSPDNTHLLSASGDRTLRLWDIKTGQCKQIFKGHQGRIREGIFFPDGKKIISASNDNTLRIWETYSGECLTILQGHQGGVRCCVYSPLKDECISGAEDSTIRIWNTLTGECLYRLGRMPGA